VQVSGPGQRNQTHPAQNYCGRSADDLRTGLEIGHAVVVDIDQIVAALDQGLTLDEVALVEQMVSKYGRTIPVAQLREEIALAIAIHRRG